MVTCQVYKNVELLKFLEVEGIDLILAEELCSDIYRESYSEDRKFTASIRVFAVGELSESKEEFVCIIQSVGYNPNESLQVLARMIEGESRRLFKVEKNPITQEEVKGEEIIVPPMKHTPCEIVNDQVDYTYFDCENEVLVELDYSKYE